MTYSILHAGVALGTTDFERHMSARQRMGVFSPTSHGIAMFPQLSCALTAAAELDADLRRLGLSVDESSPDDLEKAIESTDAGRRMYELGKALSEVEVRSPAGQRVSVATIAFIDVNELAATAGPEGAAALAILGQIPAGVRPYLVSATLVAGEAWPTQRARTTAVSPGASMTRSRFRQMFGRRRN